MDPHLTNYVHYLHILNDPALRTTADNFDFKYVSKEFMQEIIEKVQKDQLEKLRQSAFMNCPWFENSKTNKMSKSVISSGQDNKKIIEPITSEAAKQDEQYEYSRIRFKMTDDQVERLIQDAVDEVLSKKFDRSKIKSFSYSIVNEELDEDQPRKDVEEHNKLEDNISTCSMSSIITVESVPRAESLVWDDSKNIRSFEHVGNKKTEMVDLDKINKNEDDKHVNPKLNNPTDFENASTRNSSRSELSEMNYNEPFCPKDPFSDSLSVNFENQCFDNDSDSERKLFAPYNNNPDSKQSKASFTSVDLVELKKMLGISANIVDMEKEQLSDNYETIDNAWEIDDDVQCDIFPVIPFPQLSISSESLSLHLENLKSNATWRMINLDSLSVTPRKVTISTQTETPLPSNHSSKTYCRISRSVQDSPEVQIAPETPKPETNQKNEETNTLLNEEERNHILTKITDHQNKILKTMKQIRHDLVSNPSTITKADRVKMEYRNNEFASRLQKTHIHQLKKMIINVRCIPLHQFHSATSNAPLTKLCAVYDYLFLSVETYGEQIKNNFSQIYPRKLDSLFKLAMKITLTGIEKNIYSMNNKFIKTFLDKCEYMVYFLGTQKDTKNISDEKYKPTQFSRMEEMRVKNRLYMYETPKKIVRKKIPKNKVEQPQIQKRNTQTLKNSLKTDVKRTDKETTIKKVEKNVDRKKEPKCELKISKNVNKKDVKTLDKNTLKKTESKTDQIDESKKSKNKKICYKTCDKLSDTPEDIRAYVLPRYNNVTGTELEILSKALNITSKKMPKDSLTGNQKSCEQKNNVLKTGDDRNCNAKQKEEQHPSALRTELQLGLSESNKRNEALLTRRRCLTIRKDNDVLDASSTPVKLQLDPDFGLSANAAKDHSKEDEDGARALPPFLNPNIQQQPVQHKPKFNTKRNLKTGKNTKKQMKMPKNLRPNNISNKTMNETVPTQASSIATREMNILNLIHDRNRYLTKLGRNPLYRNRIFSEPWKVIPRLANDLLDGLIISTMKDINWNFEGDFLKSELKS